MTSPNRPFSRALAAIFLAALGALILVISFQKQHWDSDILWALKSGEWILERFEVPLTDPFSYTFGGKPWVDFTWGFQVLARLFYDYLGKWAGLYVLQAGLISATFAFMYVTLRRTIEGVWPAIALLYLAFITAHTRFIIRPHLFEYFFVSLYFMLFTLYERKNRPVYLYALIPLQVVWVNVHSSAILGLFMAGSYAAGEVIDALREKRLKRALDGDIKRYSFIAAVLPIASLLNPYGLKLVVFAFIHNSVDNKDALRHIGEWTKPHLKELFFYFYPFPPDRFAFALLAALTAIAILLNLRRLKARSVFLMLAAVYMAVSHVRWIALFAFFAVPVIALNIAGALDEKKDRPILKTAAFLLSLCLAVALVYDIASPGFRRHLGLGLSEGQFPSGTVDFMRRNNIRGNIYNEYVFGGYLINEYPEVKVFIDGRTPTVYSSYFFWTSRLVNDRKLWDKVVEEHSIDMALVKLDSAFCGKLRENDEWAPVSFDQTSALFLKKGGQFKEVVSRHAFKELNPCSDSSRYTLPDDMSKLKAIRLELRRAISEGADGFGRPHRILGLVDLKLAGVYLDEGAGELKRASEIARDAHTWHDYGTILGRLKKKAEAVEAFKNAISIDKGFKDSYLGLGLAYHDMKVHKEAVCYLLKYIEMADDKADLEAYRALGLSYFELSKFEEAGAYLKRAAFLENVPKEAGNLNYFTANALIESGEFEEAAIFYEKALRQDPEYRAVFTNLKDRFKGQKKGAIIKGVLEKTALTGKRPDGR
ncbi:MAG: hypothetical protein A2X99_08370 [Deltaproteobacteria bacterium GWB2_55_19]|nr:MAG: hypothetical protein A2X99_08370 [Deltaproteobacteria bacterium GWB2_55_19]HAO94217.1 hypothetical protein [Deltaproteobacteria bacterium]